MANNSVPVKIEAWGDVTYGSKYGNQIFSIRPEAPVTMEIDLAAITIIEDPEPADVLQIVKHQLCEAAAAVVDSNTFFIRTPDDYGTKPEITHKLIQQAFADAETTPADAAEVETLA